MKELLANWQILNERLRKHDLTIKEISRLIMWEREGKNRDMILSRLRSRRRMLMREEEE